MGKYLYKNKNKNKNKHSTIILCNKELYDILNNFVFCEDENSENSNIKYNKSDNIKF